MALSPLKAPLQLLAATLAGAPPAFKDQKAMSRVSGPFIFLGLQ